MLVDGCVEGDVEMLLFVLDWLCVLLVVEVEFGECIMCVLILCWVNFIWGGVGGLVLIGLLNFVGVVWL